MSKQIFRCPKCGEKESICIEVRNRMCYPKMAVCMRCNYRSHRWEFEPFVPTVFDRITDSPEVLAPKFIFKQWHAFDGKWGWFSLLLMDGDTLDSPWFESYEEAYAATVAKLKEVEK